MTIPASTAPDETAQPKASIWEDFIDIFYAPSQVFARRRSDPKFGLALVVFIALLIVLVLIAKPVLMPIIDAEFSRGAAAAIRKNPQVTMEQMERFRSVSEKFFVVGVAFQGTVVVLLTALTLWLVGKLFDARQSFTAAAMVATYANFPKLLATVLGIVQGYLLPPESLNSMFSISLSPARFLNADVTSPLTLAALSRLDLTTIWATVLLAIGLSITGSIPRRSAAIAAFIVWLIGSAVIVLQATRQM